LAVDGLAYLPWDEASERTFDLALALGAAFERELPFEIAGGEAREPLAAADGTPVGTLVRRWAPLRGRIVASASPSGAYRSLRIALENTGAALEGSSRDAALEAALLSAHVLLAVRGGRILSTIDPPDDARALVDGAKPNGLWLVLAGEPAPDEHASTVALAAPIILYDFPKVSAKTQGDAFDATEIDELLHLSVLSLSDEERAEARATDPRARAIVERAERLSAERIGELHDGTLERFGSDPFAQLDLPAFDCVFVGGTKVAKGSLVRLRPQRRADIWDRFLVGKLARVQAIHQDLEDRFYVAVTVEDDPASEYHEWYGRSFFFDPDEVEPVAAGDAVR
ncbi:MAG: hypothetical protein ACREM2_01680, partial [Vulcanimicrobiaceae bacterium]